MNDRAAPARRGLPTLPLLLLGLLILGACGDREDGKGRLEIAVIPKGTTHEFWKSIHAGALKAEKELDGVSVVWRGTQREDDKAAQVGLVQDFVANGIDAIVLAPMDDEALVAPVKMAAERKIPVIIIDSGLRAEAGRDFASFVATDNRRGGALAAAELARKMGDRGRALLLRYREGSASTTEREQGFLEEMKRHPGVTVVDPGRYAGATRDSARETAENLLDGDSRYEGIFCSNESATYGMLLALRNRGLAGKIAFAGFDASPGLIEALEKDEIHSLVVQDPMRMGYLGVMAAVRVLRGEPVEPNQDTGCVLVTRANATEPAVDELLHPDLSKWLDR